MTSPIKRLDSSISQDVVIRVENLFKEYRLGTISHGTLRQDVQSWWARIRGREDPNSIISTVQTSTFNGSDNPHFLALKDISFEVKRGEVLGIIGRNGAGKSTLLKILSEVTLPTKGTVKIKGRVASLLEVGTGFHPELTGRENIYLNGAILGMTKAEIQQKFDQIVAFAEVEKFIDTPVKRYSSGMYVRLAFAVAAHLESEILIVDEVLAVGDAQFQKKCLGKISDVSHAGRTVLFVSHNMAAIEYLCHKGIVLNRGKVEFKGNQTTAITQYLNSFSVETSSLSSREDRIGSGEIKVIAIDIKDNEEKTTSIVTSGKDIEVHFHFETTSSKPISNILIGMLVRTQSGVPVFIQHNNLTKTDFGEIHGKGSFVCRINKLPLPPAIYTITYSIMSNYGLGSSYIDSIEAAASMTVIAGDFFGTGDLPGIVHGVCLVEGSWRIQR